MPDGLSRPPYIPVDILTPDRDVTHGHFAPGDQVVVLKGVAGGELWGDAMTVVTPSWHTPTDEDGWRLRDPDGGERTYVTGHPRYLVHLSRRCHDCLIYLRAMEDYLLPKLTDAPTRFDCGWYNLTALDQLVHVNDARNGR
ncbi:hypothetical protein [Streptomyces celluloflavus]|uniref:hypothetical protein n=1 Tax=Streptomyces celluloflavus TaxID=58344 RepID=UPI003460185C|nr:hypothetical protein OG717_29760 [Streptomyces celluloflavus]